MPVRVLGVAYGLVLLSGVVYLDYYACCENAENHTGIPIGAMLVVYGLTFLVALVALVLRRPGATMAWWLLVVSGIAIANVVALDAMNVMMEKDRWIEKGMPDR